MDIKCKLHNKWDVLVRDAKTEEIVKEGVGYNIILNQFWDVYLLTDGNSHEYTKYIHFGSGTTSPSASNTQLGTLIGSKLSANTAVDYSHWKADGYITVQKSCRLEAADHNGTILAEVGFASGTGATTLRTHSLLKDMNGNAITIEKTDAVVIDIYGTFYYYIPWTLDDGDIAFSGYAGGIQEKLIGLAGIGNITAASGAAAYRSGFTRARYKGWSGGSTTNLLGTSTTNEFAAAATLSTNVSNKTMTYSFANIPVGSGNVVGGLNGIMLGEMLLKIPCTGFTQSAITKEVVGTGDGSNSDFATDFGFVLNNSTFKAYVNDVEVSATCDYMLPPPNTNPLYYVKYLPTSVDGWGTNGPTEFEWPFYASLPITGFGAFGTGPQIYTSDDGTTWELAASGSSAGAHTISIPSGHQGKRYWKLTGWQLTSMITALATLKNVHLAVAPGSGDTVAVTYQPDVIAKDASHTVKDISVTFTFAEYTP